MKSRYTILSFLILVASLVNAQQLDMEKLKGIDVRSIGPAGMSGRITAIDVVTKDPSIMYVGSASGGLWKSVSGGIDWDPVFDDQPVLSIGAVAIQQSNPDVIWAGTGEGNPRNSLNGGFGIYKSLDAGKTWKLMGLEKTRNIHRIKIDYNNPNTVYVASIGSPWGEHPERGVYKTTDGGVTWKLILSTNNRSGAADLVMDPENPQKLFAAMWEHHRDPWYFESGGEGSGLYMTVDGGVNWKKLSDEDGLPKGVLGRIGIAVAPSDNNRVYALVEAKKNALYRSDDGGYKWKKISDKGNEIGNRPFYYSEIYVDPVNENRLYTIFTYVNVSEDGGKSFKQLMPAYNTSKGVHPDHHAWWIHPEDPDFMMDGNDGGLNITHDRGKTWRFVENLPVGQFYHISTDNEYPYNVYGGMQDNGSWGGPAYVWKSQGIRNSYWQELAFGDGFDVVPYLKNPRYGFAMSQQGYVVRYDKETGQTRGVRPIHFDPEVYLRFNWNAAIAQDPFDPNTIYFGSQFVHKSTDLGNTWDVISPDLTTNDPEKQKAHESGGLTYDASGAENNTTILTIAPSPVEKDVIWAGTDDGYIQITKDGGESWQNVTSNITGFPKAGWVAQIKVSEINAGEAFAVVNNYRNFDFKPYLFHTKDYGLTWTNLVNENQVWNYTLAFVQDKEEPSLMFLGSEGGLYVSVDAGKNWTQWKNDFPSVPTMDLVIHPRENDLVIGTFGRSIWVMDDIRPLREIARQGAGTLNNTFELFDPPVAYHNLNQQPSGTRFGANGIFNGENRRTGAMITYLINKPVEAEDEKVEEIQKPKKGKKKRGNSPEPKEQKKDTSNVIKYDSVFLEIFDGNKKIRNLKWKSPKENGIHRAYWRLDQKGVPYPSRSKPKKNASEPSGVQVLPGEYKLRMTFGDQVDSAMVTVKSDPRTEINMEDLEVKQNFLIEILKLREKAARASARLVESKNVAQELSNRMKEIDKEKFKEEIKFSKTIIDTIDQLMEPLLGEDQSEIQGFKYSIEPSISSRISKAYYYGSDAEGKPGDTEKTLFRQAEETLNEYLRSLNDFFSKDWEEYKSKMESVEVSPFKSFDAIE